MTKDKSKKIAKNTPPKSKENIQNIPTTNHTIPQAETKSTKNKKDNPIKATDKYFKNGWEKVKSSMKGEYTPQWALAILTFFIVILTIVTICYNDSQLRQSEKFAKIETRAYIRLNEIDTRVDVINLGVGGRGWMVLKITNCGKTPAFQTYSICKIRLDTLIKESDWNSLETEKDSCKAIAPGQTVEIRGYSSSEITKEDSVRICNTRDKGAFAYIFYGKTWFDDSFGVHHWIRYCRGYKEWSHAWYYPSHNDCDNNE